MRSAIAAVAWSMILIVSPAKAAETGDRCYSPAEASQIMASEHELLVIIADEGVADNAHLNSQGLPETKFVGEFYYYNPDNKEAYIISADTPLGVHANCAKIEIKLKDAILFDARISDVDPLAKIAGNRALAAKECRALHSDPNKCYHNDYLEVSRRNGFNVFLQGTMQNHSANGNTVADTVLTLVGSVQGPPGGVETISTFEGAVIPTGVMSQVLYTQKGGDILNHRVESARKSAK